MVVAPLPPHQAPPGLPAPHISLATASGPLTSIKVHTDAERIQQWHSCHCFDLYQRHAIAEATTAAARRSGASHSDAEAKRQSRKLRNMAMCAPGLASSFGLVSTVGRSSGWDTAQLKIVEDKLYADLTPGIAGPNGHWIAAPSISERCVARRRIGLSDPPRRVPAKPGC